MIRDALILARPWAKRLCEGRTFMPRNVVLVCAAVLAAFCFACVAVLPSPPPSSPLLAAGQAPRVKSGLPGCRPSDGTTFADAVQVLAPGSGYDPSTLVPPPPNMLGTLSNKTQTWQDLADGFNAAPPNFRQKLCNLTAVYIDTTTCPGNPQSCFGANSWGFRNPNNTDERYLALSQGIWGSIGHSDAGRYSVYETNLLAQVMAQENMRWPLSSATPPRPAFSGAFSGSTSIDDVPALTVLAALAHEYGHILWYDVLKTPHNNNYKPSVLCRPNPNNKGGGFFDNSWDGMDVNRPRMWLRFGEMMGDQHAHGITQISTLARLIQTMTTPDEFQMAAAAFDSLYDNDNNSASGVWPSLFGAISPEEDFVETFKIYILTRPETNSHMPITSMQLNIFGADSVPPNQPTPAFTPDIFADLGKNLKKELAAKIRCIHGHF